MADETEDFSIDISLAKRMSLGQRKTGSQDQHNEKCQCPLCELDEDSQDPAFPHLKLVFKKGKDIYCRVVAKVHNPQMTFTASP